MQIKVLLLSSLFWSFLHSRAFLKERDLSIPEINPGFFTGEAVDTKPLGPIDYPFDVPPEQAPRGTLGKAPPKEASPQSLAETQRKVGPIKELTPLKPPYKSKMFLPTAERTPLVQCPRWTNLPNCGCREACYDLSTRRMDYPDSVKANFQDCLAEALYNNKWYVMDGKQPSLSIAWHNFEIGDGTPNYDKKIADQKKLPKCMHFENHADLVNIIDKPNCQKFVLYDIWDCPEYNV
ncbi:MAG: hypothetical protein M1829_001977 [Trizodia sp. TS-e1964]|nr:MAG: hypothetical protein M1829_001977 [Trizodia sp. TS-e1964]